MVCSEHARGPGGRRVTEISARQVHVWVFELDGMLDRSAQLESVLSVEEHERSARLKAPQHQRRFAAAHAVLRILLARYLQMAPQAITFRHGPRGKPCIKGQHGRDGLQFNLSHSAGVAAVALARGGTVGIDIEVIRDDVAVEAVANRFFSREEADRLARLPPEARRRQFFGYWTCKEAVLKALGLGIAIPLSHCVVMDGVNQHWVEVRIREGSRKSRWRVSSFEPKTGVLGAVTFRGADWSPRHYTGDAAIVEEWFQSL